MILIRADANEIIGTGHVMRCLSVASAFCSAGETVKFVTADHKSDVLIKRRDFDVICLESNYAQMECETAVLLQLIKQKQPRLLLVDSYYVTNGYFRALSPYTKIAYFDDINSTRWDVDYLINYNIFASYLDYSWYAESGTKLLLGPEYAPLRTEFQNSIVTNIRDQVSDVFVSAGGTDPEGIIEKIINRICPLMKNVKFHFVIGLLNPRLEQIKQLERDNVVLHVNEIHMSKLMRECDVAIAAAGSTLYELCDCGIPTITYTLADNQILAAEAFDREGIMINAGDCRGDVEFTSKVKTCLDNLIRDINIRITMSRKMQNLVDGKGSERIAEALLKE